MSGVKSVVLSPLSPLLSLLSLLSLFFLAGCGLTIPITVETDPSTIDGNALCLDPELMDVLPETLTQPIESAMSTTLDLAFDLLGPEISAEVEAQDTGPVSAIVPVAIVLSQVDPPADPGPVDSLGFLSSLVITLEATGDLPEVELARAEDIPDDATRIVFDVNEDLDLNPYIEAGISLSVAPSLKTCPQEDVAFATELSVEVQF